MAQQGVFTLPARINFGATVLTNAANVQNVAILVDNEVRATFSGSGITDKNLGTQVVNSGTGNVRVTVTVNGKASDLVSTQVILANKVNLALLGSEDGTDADYNDAIVLLNWPLG
ncbi:fucose-binding lectin [Chromobacterium subtsugae]|uniref:Fucose-binding lectin n=1 Tax=Chromobacterium subtsugae TaxID=251747 RepID=A0ABS7FGW1_9NEIS|nr:MULTISPECIES: fucose-binding lectin II [Chromobacterium]KUM01698.1 fucose-binding lectin [Chromobacterium subtsugae]KZE84585.1 fucose-binding lectin [Chromobacterium sp. F49]MBW7568213.1 fucose-binding lectin [Chromobacterium subtsugae]MBW8289323.1 fucose-binding lectin [Chromobacterium subtsugae]OBU87532.1 fucose-binding lectin [Chromobacterium subtsugae]